MTSSLPLAFLGNSPAIQHLCERLRHAADSRQEVLLTGEPGTGKRLAAALLHQQGPRRHRPLIRLRQGNLTVFLDEASRHAYEQHPGSQSQPPPSPWFQDVQGSTLLLEDVGDWSKKEQSRITGILRCRTTEKVAASRPWNSTSRSSPPPGPTLHPQSGPAASGPTSTTASTASPSNCPRCATTARTSRSWPSTS